MITEVEVVSSSPARGSFLQIDKPKMCEGASSMQIDEHKKLRSRNVEPYAQYKRRHVLGGGEGGTSVTTACSERRGGHNVLLVVLGSKIDGKTGRF